MNTGKAKAPRDLTREKPRAPVRARRVHRLRSAAVFRRGAMGDPPTDPGADRYGSQRQSRSQRDQDSLCYLRPGFAGDFPPRRLANTDYWGNQVPAVAAHHTVILMASRGHGLSPRDARPYGYDLRADDVVALMDVLKIPKADVVGWSDGGILGLDLAMRHKDRVGKVFAFAANTVTSGVVEGVEKNPTFAAYIERPATNMRSIPPRPRN